jgi:hypothetical protein
MMGHDNGGQPLLLAIFLDIVSSPIVARLGK